MASTGEWELVVKGSKKGKGATVANGKLNKEEKKQFIQKAPRVTLTGGIEVVAAGKENRKPKSPKAASAPKKKKPEKKNNVGPYQPGTLEEAVCRLSVGEMQNLLDVVVSRFYDSPLIWLKDLASYLNVRVNPVHSPDPAFRGHPNTFPASLLGSEVKKLLVNTLSGCTDNVLALFHKHCITSMVQEQIKGLGVAGYKLFLQILSINHAHVGVMNLPYYCDLRHNIQNQTPACLSMLWAVGQSGLDDFTVGLKVWMELMVPLIGLKNYSAYVVDYGSTVFGGGGGDGAEDCGDVLGVREFFTILDFTWCSSVSLPKPVQRQLFALYPKVKTAAFSSSPEVTLRNFFPSFLRRLDPNVSHALRVELLTCLVQCLTQDPQCWSIWSQLYLKHLPQSAVLLHHLGREWKILSRSLRVQRKEVRETIEGFAESNEQMSHKARAVAGVIEATEATKVLLNQMKTVKGKSPLPRVMKLLGIVLVTAIIWDIRSAGSFYGSKLGQTVERAGLVPYLETFGQASKAAFIHSYKWCVINIPVFYIRGCELAAPYLLLMMEKVEGIIGYCSAALASAEEYIPVLKEKIETSVPGLRASAGHYGTLALETMQVGFLAIKDALTPYLAEAHKFFSTRVFVGPLAPEKLQEYMIGAVDYLSQLLLRMHSSLVSALQDPDTTTNKTS
ncbi:transmembrane protein 214-B-like [Homarus americanus]|uniref:transmembrane protein 214-B-like n=1 Tax=Homarus americanus TaxID=6706 RepID=UPI001C44106E|nr:transmembrane protein 214-B-like [Homarus americanus]